MTPGDFEDDQSTEILPENWPIFELFSDMRTQWRCGPGGAVGLDYLVIYRELEVRTIPVAEWPQWMSDIRELEASAIEAMREGD